MKYLPSTPLLLALLLWLASPSIVQGQILNIEKTRLDNDSTERLLGNIAAQFNLQQRNQLILSALTTLNMHYTTKKHSFIGIGNWHWIKVEGTNFVSDGYLHLRATLLRTRVLSYEFFGQGQYDGIRGMARRYLVGSNFRIQLQTGEKRTTTAGFGAMYEWETWQHETDTVNTALLKSNIYLSLQYQFSKHVAVNLGGYYQARFDTFFKPRITGDAHLIVQLSKKLAITNKFSLIHDAAPVIPIDKLVYTWQTGVQYSF